MDEQRRTANYLAQTGRTALTARQARQIRRKHHNDTRTERHIRNRQNAIMAAVSIGSEHYANHRP